MLPILPLLLSMHGIPALQPVPSPTPDALTISLKPQADGVRRIRGGAFPLQVALTPAAPPSIKKLPELHHPHFGTLKLGERAHEAEYLIVIDEALATDAAPPDDRLFVDANADGDLTNDPPCAWDSKPYTGRDQKPLTQHTGAALLQLVYPSGVHPAHFTLTRLDKSDPRRADQDVVSATPDYGLAGTITIAGKPHTAYLFDQLGSGDYRSGATTLMLDLNGNDAIDRRGEKFETSAPFCIDAITYEVTDLQADGTFKITRSAKSVKEQAICCDLRVGDSVGPFELPAIDGSKVRFPDDFKGRQVLFHSWTDQSPDAKTLAAKFTAAQTTLSPRPISLVGLPLNRTDPAKDLKASILASAQSIGLTWPHIWYLNVDGLPELARRLGLDVPWTAVLVDADTGKVVVDTGTLAKTLSEASHLGASDKSSLSPK